MVCEERNGGHPMFPLSSKKLINLITDSYILIRFEDILLLYLT